MYVPPLTSGRPVRLTAEGARSSAVEHYVDIVGVTGSIPVAPTIYVRGWRERPPHKKCHIDPERDVIRSVADRSRTEKLGAL